MMGTKQRVGLPTADFCSDYTISYYAANICAISIDKSFEMSESV